MSQKHYKNKKAELKFIVFLVVFVSVLGIMGSIFVKSNLTLIQKQETNTNAGFFASIMNFLINDVIEKIPVLNGFYRFVTASFTLMNIHPYLKDILIVLFGIPLAYIILMMFLGNKK